MEASRRWGDDRAILDDDEARARLLDAAGRCIVRRGRHRDPDGRGVRRGWCVPLDALSLLSGTRRPVARTDPAPHRQRAVQPGCRTAPSGRSAPLPTGNRSGAENGRPGSGRPVEPGAFAAGSSALATVLELGSEPIAEVPAPLRAAAGAVARAGRLYDDIDDRSVVEWLHTTSLFLLAVLAAPTPADKRRFVDRFLVRASSSQIRQ